MTYKHNGNIKTLQGNQRKHQLSGTNVSYALETVDNLTYTYGSAQGNQLAKVEDAVAVATGTGDFKNNANLTTEYTYNTDGNLTADKNKGIDSVHYNMLGKVRRIKFTDGRVITCLYDASGNKLKMKTYQGGTPQNTIDYVGGFVYQDGALSFLGSPEGRVVKYGSAFEYQYGIADHQGNTRVVFTSATPAPDAPTATFEGGWQ
jgi:YD repeat-containing protein